MIDDIVIVGGGSSGWMTAATLIRAFPEKNITVIESKDVPIIGVGESTLGFIRRWTRFIGLDEDDFFKYTDASYKLSIKFTDFYKKDSGGFHYPFGRPYMDQGRNSYDDWFLKKYIHPDTPVQDFVRTLFPGAALFENNKFSLNMFGEFDNFDVQTDVAYHFDATKFGMWLRDRYCFPRGVKKIEATVEDIKTSEDGVECLILDNGSFVTADLFVDCTGFKSLLLGQALNEPFDSFSEILPNNSAWATRIEYKDKELELEGFTNCTAIQNGWVWNIPLWSRLGTGYVYSDKFVSDEEALEEFKRYLTSDKMVIPRSKSEVEQLSFKNIKMRVGIHNRTFVKNVVAIGLAAGFIEPLESNGLYSVHEFLFRLVDILQRNEVNEFDRYMYNSVVRSVFDSFANFVSLHYALSHRDDTEYWRAIQKRSLHDKLPHMHKDYSNQVKTYYNTAYNYLENWTYDRNSVDGLTFIATGMNMMMVNTARAVELEFNNGINIEQLVKEMTPVWEKRKQKWNFHAQHSPSLAQFLKVRFYE